MPFVSHLRLTWGGALGSLQAEHEIWSTGLAIGSDAPVVALPDILVMNALAEQVRLFHARPATGIGDAAQLQWATLAWVGQNGRVPRTPAGAFEQHKFAWAAPILGGGGNVIHPPQVALVASLGTEAAGAVGRGRMFLPAPVFPINADWGLTVGQQNGVAQSVRTLVSSLNQVLLANGEEDLSVVVASGGSITQGIAPANRKVVSFRVGRLMDTIRTRRNALSESYVTVPLVG